MNKYLVTVNGTCYEVEVELMDKAETIPEKKAETDPAPALAGAGEAVKCPMPGTILDVRCSEGQTVKKGDVLFILEAMKMENEIMASQDGTVSSIAVKKGDAVSTGAPLCTIA